jgi:hypothetical protein
MEPDLGSGIELKAPRQRPGYRNRKAVAQLVGLGEGVVEDGGVGIVVVGR